MSIAWHHALLIMAHGLRHAVSMRGQPHCSWGTSPNFVLRAGSRQSAAKWEDVRLMCQLSCKHPVSQLVPVKVFPQFWSVQWLLKI